MTHYVEGGFKTFVAAADLGANISVKLDSNGKIVAATAGTDVIIGTTVAAVTTGDSTAVRLRSAAGTTIVTASAAISRGAAVTATTGGKVVTTTTANDQIIGYALEAAGADGDLLEVLNSTGKV